jgi:hypothetical protein
MAITKTTNHQFNLNSFQNSFDHLGPIRDVQKKKKIGSHHAPPYQKFCSSIRYTHRNPKLAIAKQKPNPLSMGLSYEP